MGIYHEHYIMIDFLAFQTKLEIRGHIEVRLYELETRSTCKKSYL